MPIFVVLHTYKMEDFIKNIEAAMNFMKAAAAGELPGANLCSSYSDGIERSWCVWEAESKEAVEKVLAPHKYMTTEVVPVMQGYPPGPDLYTLLSMVPQFKDLLP